MRALITGVTGFVGRYLAQNLLDNGYEVWGGTRKCPPYFINGVQIVELNLSRQDMIVNVLEDIKPDVVFHLSGQSSVKYSWDHIEETFKSNVMDSINLLEAIKNSSLKSSVRVITIGSSEEYGVGAELPIVEEARTDPMNPYGLSKLTVGKIALLYHGLHRMDIIHARAFNHIGPGQSLGFVTTDFTKQVIEIENGKVEPVMYVGDLSSKRDFTDVRDIVEAYRLLNEKGTAGETYNVCSGVCIPIRGILDDLVSFSSSSIKVIVDEKKLRPNNVKEYYGSNDKLRKATGWKPLISISQSLHDIYLHWKNTY
ncbi:MULTISPECIES: GDP-mannose 4,6-dehydratase [unclassified Paenibacillus]|uniref:GDP-mannose 4,6-dehydratase n=1 Tax=unclassified Paenibacillus TaxID=185978 RepID=UPI001AE950D0|nr:MULTISPECIES: GDP-mannose 4,6-dehydratase [unclassified Paenibacillus]MBP1157473.1 GDP-4-dehydro-6-deoxy-D-mannose reductase [Paenibacillus sp. PvP091]MBP1171790.1 GDP-4-dehydro-6-deoxy-D-mannose reductase [Paenibacillus sp. PvR098]MBP2438171.1 GDP-4-dehydro-6-deoxy-D-mannose reductase [Paenibacillus sp. PvP052]